MKRNKTVFEPRFVFLSNRIRMPVARFGSSNKGTYLCYMSTRIVFFLVALFFGSCNPARPKFYPNPAAPGFNAAGSDPKAIQLADEVMQAQGGRGAWDALRYLSWDFFGRRTLLWDKFTGNVRIDWKQPKQTVVVNIQTGAGKVWLNEVEQQNPDTLQKYLQIGKNVWINDSYWLVMPFKLKDTGVTLKYLGTSNTEAGATAEVLELTFAGVGVTPDNKYQVWIDQQSKLVTQWAFFERYDDSKPRFTTPWENYQTMSPIPLQLSSERGGGRSLSPIATPTSVPKGIFEQLK